MNERQTRVFPPQALVLEARSPRGEPFDRRDAAGRHAQHSRRGRPRQRGDGIGALELRTRDRQPPPPRKLIAKIDSALRRIDEGEYGYCESDGRSRSRSKRLDARPIATMSLEAQERHERREKVHRDD